MDGSGRLKKKLMVIILGLLVILAGLVAAAFIMKSHGIQKNKSNDMVKEELQQQKDTVTLEPTEASTPEPTETSTPEPTKAVTPEPTETSTPEPTEEPIPESIKAEQPEEPSKEEETVVIPDPPKEEIVQSTGRIVAIDPGHQLKGNSEHEPIGPGASQTKPKVSSGTYGRTTGVPEYELVLDVSLKLRDELAARGYQVVMIRETHEVDISNAQRAQMAADSGADVFIRVHANGSDNSSVAGALTMAPSEGNAFVPSDLARQCQQLSQVLIDEFCAVTGAQNRGVMITDSMSGLNWCSVPSSIIELGFMTNPDEDIKMQTEDYQNLMVQGMADGIDRYFAVNQ